MDVARLEQNEGQLTTEQIRGLLESKEPILPRYIPIAIEIIAKNEYANRANIENDKHQVLSPVTIILGKNRPLAPSNKINLETSEEAAVLHNHLIIKIDIGNERWILENRAGGRVVLNEKDLPGQEKIILGNYREHQITLGQGENAVSFSIKPADHNLSIHSAMTKAAHEAGGPADFGPGKVLTPPFPDNSSSS